MARNGITQWGWKEMEEMLQCPVCLDIPSPGMIEQCRHGHHVCASCRKNVESCPLCKCEFYGTRNFILEELVRHFDIIKNTMLLSNMAKKKIKPVKIRNDSATQTLKSLPPRRKVHTPLCSRGLYPCKAPDCTEILPLGRLLNHVRMFHKENLTESAVDLTHTYTQTFEIPFTTNKLPINKNCFIIFVSGIGLIFLTIELLKTGELIAYLHMALNHAKCQDYLGSILLFSEASTVSYTYDIRLLSSRVDFTTMMLNYKCLALSKAQLTEICANKKFKCTLTLTRYDHLSYSISTQPLREEVRFISGVRASLISEQNGINITKPLQNADTNGERSLSHENIQGAELKDLVAKVIQSLNLKGVISNAVISSTVAPSTSAAVAPKCQESTKKQNAASSTGDAVASVCQKSTKKQNAASSTGNAVAFVCQKTTKKQNVASLASAPTTSVCQESTKKQNTASTSAAVAPVYQESTKKQNATSSTSTAAAPVRQDSRKEQNAATSTSTAAVPDHQESTNKRSVTFSTNTIAAPAPQEPTKKQNNKKKKKTRRPNGA